MDDQNNPNNTDDVIVEAEVISEEVVEETPVDADTPVGDAAILLNLEEMIKSYITSLDRLRDEQRKHREMFEDSFQNDPIFRENSEKAKEALKVKNTTRQQIVSQPSVIAIANKIKSVSGEIKEKQNSLSDYLLEYQRLTGSNEIEDNDGQLREIINSAKLIKRSTKK